ncbi:MAG: hypothetical protein SOU49_08360 [Sodaliphilus pleomorphus]|uniref:hypothetical protein n=1 Tax=Sodaliphilus pleomorphus TaxID=2606626 RepID=UPI0023F38666|nr:hypothetical protein [Sodaliphilus pleomorphus]MDD7065334.1 hypothetical protein [Sodaliphilus pleomorphus]MDY2832739.1 hypothetical protein [Sodaliphilus pleomorphus]
MLTQDYITSDGLTDVELIERFLCGNMDADEEARFMASLNADEQRRSKAIAMAYLVKAMKAEGTRHDRQLIQAMSSLDRSDVAQVAARAACGPAIVAAGGHKKEKLLYGFITTLSVVAAIVIVFWGSRYYIDYRHTTRLADEYATAFVMEPAATRGTGDEEVARTMSRLFASVRSGKRLPVVQDRLSKLWKLSLQPTYNDYTPYSSLIGWNLAIAYLKNNDKTRAREVLTVLASHADSDAVRAKAAELLAKLE